MAPRIPKDVIRAVGLSLAHGETDHINHDGCPAGEDTKGRLYVTKTDNGILLAYCHHCGGKGVVTSKIQNIREDAITLCDEPLSTTEGTLASGREIDATLILANKPGVSGNDGVAHKRLHPWFSLGAHDVTSIDLYEEAIARFLRIYQWYGPYMGGYEYIGDNGLWSFHKRSNMKVPTDQTCPQERTDSTYGVRVNYNKSTAKSALFVNPCVKCDSPIFVIPQFSQFEGQQNVLILTEDLVSAQVLASFGFAAMPLFGTHLKPSIAHRIAMAYDFVTVWFDNDSMVVEDEAVQITRLLELFGCFARCMTRSNMFLSPIQGMELENMALKVDPKRYLLPFDCLYSSVSGVFSGTYEERYRTWFGNEVLENVNRP